MKNILKTISLLLVALLMATSCEEFLDVNTDPNNPTTVPPELVLTTAQKYTAEYIKRDRRISHLGGMMMYNYSQADGFSWYNDEFLYLVTTSFYQLVWNNAYSAPLKQYQILDNLRGPEYANYRAIAKVMKSYHFQILVDCYGDIPYTEALQRKDEATPVYDDAQAVYDDLIVQLDSAITLIKNADATAIVPDEISDVMFAGNMTDWIRMANSVKLRILVRNSGVKDVSADVAAIEAEGTGFITTDVLINPGYAVDEGKQNPLWNDLGTDVGGTVRLSNDATCATQFIIDFLTNTNDPRIDYIYERPATGHLGVPQGLDNAEYDVPVVDQFVADNVSNIGPGILQSATMGANIFSLAEVYFLRAEAALAGIHVGDPAEYYNSGIEASFSYLGAPGASSYYAQTIQNVSYVTSADKLDAIITQKWIAVNGITAEQSWFDYSRTGFPSGEPETSTGLPISRFMIGVEDDRPVRLFYPASEITSNGENVPTQPDAFTDKIFWAGN